MIEIEETFSNEKGTRVPYYQATFVPTGARGCVMRSRFRAVRSLLFAMTENDQPEKFLAWCESDPYRKALVRIQKESAKICCGCNRAAEYPCSHCIASRALLELR